MGMCVPCATRASNCPTLRADRISAAKGKSVSVLSSRVLSGMIASTRAPGAMVSKACSRISRSSSGERSSSGAPFPVTEGAGLLLMFDYLLPKLYETSPPRCQRPSPSAVVRSALDARRAALRERAHLLDGRHRGVAGEGRQERAVRPAELQGLFGRFPVEQAVEEAGGEAVA